MSDQGYKATIQVGDKKITIEGPKGFVEEQILKISDLVSSKHTSHQEYNVGVDDGNTEIVIEKGLVEEKKPRGHLETVAVLAFALAAAGVTQFTEEDIHKAYLRARVRPPKNVAQALRDAKNRMDYIEAGEKRGTYRLSRHGDRTVRFDLPRA